MKTVSLMGGEDQKNYFHNLQKIKKKFVTSYNKDIINLG